MRSIVVAAVLTLGATACSKADRPSPTAHEVNVPAVSVDEVEQKIAAGDCVPVDANPSRTRKRLGTLPGAVLLTDYETFSLSELPADKSKPLVFYCTNVHCTASDEAAAKARTAGYVNVKVMPEGIAGWVKAGKKVQAL